MKKRTFLLLETILAFSLLTLCIVPIVTQPLRSYRRQLEQLTLVEFERLADCTFCEVKEMLLKNEIPYSFFPPRSQTSAPFSLPSMSIHIPGSNKRLIQRSFCIKTTGQKVTSKGQVTLQTEVIISLNNESYTFRAPITKVPPPPK